MQPKTFVSATSDDILLFFNKTIHKHNDTFFADLWSRFRDGDEFGWTGKHHWQDYVIANIAPLPNTLHATFGKLRDFL